MADALGDEEKRGCECRKAHGYNSPGLGQTLTRHRLVVVYFTNVTIPRELCLFVPGSITIVPPPVVPPATLSKSSSGKAVVLSGLAGMAGSLGSNFFPCSCFMVPLVLRSKAALRMPLVTRAARRCPGTSPTVFTAR